MYALNFTEIKKEVRFPLQITSNLAISNLKNRLQFEVYTAHGLHITTDTNSS